MVVVLDTNVLISSLLSTEGPPAEIIRLWEQDLFEVATSPTLLAELENTLAYPKIQELIHRFQNKVPGFLKRLQIATVFVEPEIALEVIADDPSDNRVLECAVTSEASYIVSGDKHLLNLKEYQGIIILPPAAFLALTQRK